MAKAKGSKSTEKQDNIDIQRSDTLVFISHDTRDADIAEAFSKLLSSVSTGILKSFRSSDKKGNQGIEYGVEWYPEIMKKLDESSNVVALLTKNSLNRPWILYEAGVAKGKLDTPLLGIAIGISLTEVNNSPFAQFQNSNYDIDSLCKLVIQLVKKIPNAEPNPDVIKTQVEAFIQDVDKILKQNPKQAVPPKGDVDNSSIAKLFEEVKIMFKELPTRMEYTDSMKYRKRSLFSPELLFRLSRHPAFESRKHLRFLLAIAPFKNVAPWLYDFGKETYDILKSSRSSVEKEKMLDAFKEMIHVTRDELFTFGRPELKEMMHLLEEQLYFLEKSLRKL